MSLQLAVRDALADLGFRHMPGLHPQDNHAGDGAAERVLRLVGGVGELELTFVRRDDGSTGVRFAIPVNDDIEPAALLDDAGRRALARELTSVDAAASEYMREVERLSKALDATEAGTPEFNELNGQLSDLVGDEQLVADARVLGTDGATVRLRVVMGYDNRGKEAPVLRLAVQPPDSPTWDWSADAMSREEHVELSRPQHRRLAKALDAAGVERAARFDPTQPRVPAGSPGGGQWGGDSAPKSPPKSTLSFNPETGKGSGYGKKGGDPNVKLLQAALNRLGLTDGKGKALKLDGKLGPRTTEAIKAAQTKLGLEPTGRVSPTFFKKLLGAKKLEDAAPAPKKSKKKPRALVVEHVRGELHALGFRHLPGLHDQKSHGKKGPKALAKAAAKLAEAVDDLAAPDKPKTPRKPRAPRVKKPKVATKSAGGPGPYDPDDTDFPQIHPHNMKVSQDAALESVGGKLSREQVAAVDDYTAGGYSYMNGLLRGSRTSAPQGTEARIAALESAMIPLPQNVKLSRGTNFDNLPEGFQDLDTVKGLAGQEITDLGFTSTKLAGPGREFGGKVRFEIEAPKGTRGLFVKPWANNSGENEVVLAPGSRFHVVSVAEPPASEFGPQVVLTLRVVS